MPLLGQEPRCSICKTDDCDVWEQSETGDILCDKCFETHRTAGQGEPSQHQKATDHFVLDDAQSADNPSTRSTTDTNSAVVDRRPSNSSNQTSRSSTKESTESKSSTRKSARIKPSKSKSLLAVKAQATKGRSRRVVFKKKPIKAPCASATVITSDHIFYKGFYWQVSDVVSVVDDDDGNIYYAQLRGFLQDPYNEKSAIITWLIPTTSSPPVNFDASTYILGPEEDIPRKMEYFEFVCHAPSDYFHSHSAPHAMRSSVIEPGFVWTGLKSGFQPKFGSINSQDKLEDESNFCGARITNRAEAGRRLKDTRRQSTNKEKKLK